MTRNTSVEAYHKIKEEGLIGKRQMQVYEILFEHGPLTNSEVWAFAKKKYGIMISPHGSGSRFTEMRDKGIIEEVGTRKCSITNKEVILYDVTDQLPKKLKANVKKIDNRILDAVWAEREACARIAGRNGSMTVRDLILARGNNDD